MWILYFFVQKIIIIFIKIFEYNYFNETLYKIYSNYWNKIVKFIIKIDFIIYVIVYYNIKFNL